MLHCSVPEFVHGNVRMKSKETSAIQQFPKPPHPNTRPNQGVCWLRQSQNQKYLASQCKHLGHYQLSTFYTKNTFWRLVLGLVTYTKC